MTERSAWVWYYTPPAPDGARLVAAGCDLVLVKAVWEGSVSAAGQYAEAVNGLTIPVAPWTYPLGGDQSAAEIAALATAVGAGKPPKIVLNPEAPWRGVDPATVGPYVAAVRAALPGIPVWFSSVPTWADFPYEAFCAACDGSYPQCYPGYGDVLADEARRNVTGKPVVPIAGNWSGATPLDDGLRLLGDARVPVAGLSFWQAGGTDMAGNSAGFDYAAAGRAWAAAITPGAGQAQCRAMLWAWFLGKPAWERGVLGKARWFQADFSSFQEPALVYGLKYEYGAAWCAPGVSLHMIQPELWSRIFGPGGLAVVE